MVLPLNSFGMLGEKSRRAEAVNAYFQKMEELRRFNFETSTSGLRTIHQIFLPPNLPGVFMFELSVVGYNISNLTIRASTAGYITASVNASGAVTVNGNVTSSNFGLKNSSDASSSANVTVTAQSATPTLPPCVNINVSGLADVILWSGMVRLMSYVVANRHQAPVGTELGTDAPAIT